MTIPSWQAHTGLFGAAAKSTASCRYLPFSNDVLITPNSVEIGAVCKHGL